MKVSVVIPVYNSEKPLRANSEGVLAQLTEKHGDKMIPGKIPIRRRSSTVEPISSGIYLGQKWEQEV
jgi:hypothetical protein